MFGKGPGKGHAEILEVWKNAFFILWQKRAVDRARWNPGILKERGTPPEIIMFNVFLHQVFIIGRPSPKWSKT